MAFQIVQDIKSGDTRYLEIYFSDADAAAEALIPGFSRQITITRIVSSLISGAGTTVDPAVGRKAAFAAGGFDELGSNIVGAPAARVGTIAPLEIDIGPDGNLYFQPRPDAGADNVIRAEIHVKTGWKA